MRHRVKACLDIWSAAGVTVERRGLDLHISGLDVLPDWWPSWIEANHSDLLDLLPDVTEPAREPERPPLPENRQWAFNTLSAPVSRERAREPVRLNDRRLALLRKLEEYALL